MPLLQVHVQPGELLRLQNGLRQRGRPAREMPAAGRGQSALIDRPYAGFKRRASALGLPRMRLTTSEARVTRGYFGTGPCWCLLRMKNSFVTVACNIVLQQLFSLLWRIGLFNR